MSFSKKVLSALIAVIMIALVPLQAAAAPVLRPKKVSDTMLDMINNLRKNAGLEALTADKDLMEAAEIRALESAKKYSTEHKRPNGQKFFSVSTKVWAENTSYGRESEEEVVNAFAKSAGHKANMLDKRFKIVGYACAEDDDGVLYWVQLFGTATSNYSWAMKDWGVNSFTLDPFNNPKTPLDTAKSDSASTTTPPTTKTGVTKLLDENGALTSSGLNEELKKAIAEKQTGTVLVNVKDAASISPAVLKSFADTAEQARRIAFITADSLAANSKSVQGRIILDPSKLTNLKNDIKLGITVDNNSIASVKKAMEEKYANKMAYIHMEHRGTLVADAEIIAKVDLTGLNTEKLLIYVFNAANDTCTLITEPKYSVDKNGYLHFFTKTAGDIIITDKQLGVN